jgi:hypothetical protein
MSSTAPQLTMLSAEQFAARGITISAPQDPAGLEADQIRQQLRERYGVSEIKDLVLAHVVDSRQSPAFDRTCWVVSVAGHPRSRPPRSPPIPGAFEVWFMDAQTGNLLFGTQEFGQP